MACTRTVFADLILGQSWIKIYCPSKDSTKGSLQKKKIKSVDFFHTGAGGSTPNPHFFKSVDFYGGVGGLGSNFHTFLSNFIFFKNFVLFYPVFVGWKVIFRVKLEKIFFSTL